MSDMPPATWKHVSMDFLGPLLSGEELKVLVDEYSRYPIVEIIRSVSVSTPFSHKPMVITDIQGTAITAADENHTVRRNTSRFKKMFDPLPVSENKMSGGESAAPTETIAPSTPIVELQSLESAAHTETTAPPNQL